MSIDYKAIGNRIKAQRQKRGYTQEMLAEKLDVTVGYVSQVERGITKISLDLLASISTFLDCEINILISGAVVVSQSYMSSELSEYFNRLDGRDKKLLTEFAKLLADNH